MQSVSLDSHPALHPYGDILPITDLDSGIASNYQSGQPRQLEIQAAGFSGKLKDELQPQQASASWAATHSFFDGALLQPST